ncbi:unnamed protein product [Ilex paraguariensis]|uniref:Uncharacterized protein n=1 Tax=Ilex paraguariensis TaxID=185542 RepID=A0ABC8TDG2_9AQUA
MEDLEEEIPTCVKDEDCFEDIQDVYDQLFVEFLKQQKNVLALSEKVNSSEEDRKALHVDLVKSKALLDQVSFLKRECHEIVKSKKNLESNCAKLDKDLHESNELSKRIPQSNEKFHRMLSMGKKCG